CWVAMCPPLVLLAHIIPLILVLPLCMKARQPRPKTPSKKKKGQATPSNPPRPHQQPSSGNKSVTGRKSVQKKGDSSGLAGSDAKSTMTAPVVVSKYLPSPEDKGVKSKSSEEKAPFAKSTSFPEVKPAANVPGSSTALKNNRVARSRTSKDRKKQEKGGGIMADLVPRTCEDQTIEEMTCDAVMKTRCSGRSIRSRVERVEYQEFTAVTREDRSANTCRSEYDFSEKNNQIMGNVDEDMDTDWEEYVGDRLETNVEHSCLQPTDDQMSAVICGHFRIWLANKVGSQLEQAQDAQQQ
ncbi:hypothetical protein PENTCL1PPCAC_26645, partial [Pristionchus entomophagus]